MSNEKISLCVVLMMMNDDAVDAEQTDYDAEGSESGQGAKRRNAKMSKNVVFM